jgi:hypothetical protein
MSVCFEYKTVRGVCNKITVSQELYNILVHHTGEEKARLFIDNFIKKGLSVSNESIALAIFRKLCGTKHRGFRGMQSAPAA